MNSDKYFLWISMLYLMAAASGIQAQFSVQLGCASADEAFVGIDRKAWTSNPDDASESYQLDFEIPENIPFSCSVLDYVEVSINGFSATNNIDPDCYLWLWTHALNCSSHDPVSCDEILFDQMGLQTNFILDGEDLMEGSTIGIDIVVVQDLTNSSCDQEAITNGLYSADFEICLEAFYIPDEVDEYIDLGDDIQVCPGETITLEGPDDFEIYEWEGPVDSDEQILENAPPGSYTLEVTDINGCRSSDDITITALMYDSIQLSSALPLNFCGEPDTLTVTNFQAPNFEISWIGPDGILVNEPQFQPDTSGTYTVTINDTDFDCMISRNFEVNITDAISALIIGPGDICEVSDSVEYLAMASDSMAYNFLWIVHSDTLYGNTILVMDPDTLILEISDSLDCMITPDTLPINTIIPQPGLRDTTIVTCINDSLPLMTLSDGVSDFYWLDHQGTELSEDTIIRSTGPDTLMYILVIDNIPPCVDDSVEYLIIFQNPDSDNNNLYAALCDQDSLTLTDLISQPGGIFFNDVWNMLPAPDIAGTDLKEGLNFFYYILEAGDCKSDTSFITLEKLPAPLTTELSPMLCPEESLTVNMTVYDSQNPSGVEILNSSNGCDSIVIIDLQYFSGGTMIINDTLCSNETMTIANNLYDQDNPSDTIVLNNAAQGGCDSLIYVNLSFFDRAETLVDLELCNEQIYIVASDTFTNFNPSGQVLLSDQFGCDSIINVDLQYTNSITAELTPIICPSDSVEINGLYYDISNPAGQQMLVSQNGCDSILNIAVGFHPINDTILNPLLCSGQSLQVGNEIFDENSPDGIVVLSDFNGCDSTINISLNFTESHDTYSTLTLCENDSVFLMDMWVQGPGIFMDTFNNVQGCDSIIITEILIEPCALLFSAITTSPSCHNTPDGFVTIEITDYDGTVLDVQIMNQAGVVVSEGIIDSGFSIFSDLSPGTYSISIFENGEVRASTIFIIESPEPLEMVADLMHPVCPGAADGSIALSASGGTGQIEYIWDVGSTSSSLANLPSGNYAVTLSDENNCTLDSSFNISAPEEFQWTLTSQPVPCASSATGELQLTNVVGGTPPYLFSLDGSETHSLGVFPELMAGIYNIDITDSAGCTMSVPGEIEIIHDYFIELPSEITIEAGDSVSINPSVNFEISSIFWQPSEGISCTECLNPVFFPDATTQYVVELFDMEGCSISASLFIIVEGEKKPDFYMPNIFIAGPGANLNNKIGPQLSSGSTTQILEFIVYDRWGNILFQTSGPDLAWSGFEDGMAVEPGVYIYKIEYLTAGTSNTKFEIGHFTLIK